MEISGHVAVHSNQNKVVQENSQMETVDGPKAAQAQSIDNALVVETPLTKEEVDKANRKDTESSATDSSQTHPALPFYKLFVFATSYDYLLMTLGTLGAIAHGLALPIFFLFFGNLINSFGAYQNDRQKTYHEVSKYALNFVYLGLAAFVSSWIEVACWMETGERQVEKMRIEYLKALLRQDVSFFDTQVKTGDIVDSISTNTVIVQEAISEKLGNFIHFFSTFVGGFIVGLTIVWQMGLLTLAVVPVIAFFGGIFAMSLTGLTSKSHTAYAEAGFIAEQAISQVRTVYSFVGEAKVLESYSMALKSALKLAYEGGAVKGIGVGALYGMLFCSWALLLWYGGVLVRKGSAEGGKVLSSIFAVLIGGVQEGIQASRTAWKMEEKYNSSLLHSIQC